MIILSAFFSANQFLDIPLIFCKRESSSPFHVDVVSRAWCVRLTLVGGDTTMGPSTDSTQWSPSVQAALLLTPPEATHHFRPSEIIPRYSSLQEVITRMY